MTVTVYKDEVSFTELINSVNNGNSVEIITDINFQSNDTFTSLMKVSQTNNNYSLSFMVINENEDILTKDVKTVDRTELEEIIREYLI